MVAVGLLSLVIGAAAHGQWIALAGWVYMILAVVMPAHAYVRGRKRPAQPGLKRIAAVPASRQSSYA